MADIISTSIRRHIEEWGWACFYVHRLTGTSTPPLELSRGLAGRTEPYHHYPHAHRLCASLPGVHVTKWPWPSKNNERHHLTLSMFPVWKVTPEVSSADI